MLNFRSILFCLIFFSLSSCGFRPVYKVSNNKTYDFLKKIELAPINTIEGAEFYNQLKNIIPPASKAQYILETTLLYSNGFSIIESNSDVLREMITLNVKYKIKDKFNDKIIMSGKFTRLSSYNTNSSLYANSERNQQALIDLAITAAEEVRNRIILYIENNN